jgi:aspergillopepsin I
MKLQAIFLIASIICTASAIKNARINTIHRRNYKPHGPSMYLNALLKYNIEPTHPGAMPLEHLIPHVHHLKNGVTRRSSNQTSTIPTTEQVEQFYLSPVVIGEGATAQTFNLIPDTGSPDLWVFSDQLPSTDNNHTLYRAGETPTSKVVDGESWQIMYLDGSGAGGPVYTDTVSLGDLSISKAVVEAANFTTAEFADLSADGILGLSLQPSTPGPKQLSSTIQDIINDTNTFGSPVFTAMLTRQSENPGFFTFGGISGKPNISYTDVVQGADSPAPGAWLFKSEFVVINGNRTERQGNVAVADTGTSILILDNSLVAAFYATIPGAQLSIVDQGYIFPASTTTFPTFTLPIGNTEISLKDPSDFAAGPAEEDGFLFGSIQPNGDLGFDIFGVPWLVNVYAVFDLGMTGEGKFRIGVEQRTPSPANASK